MITETDILLTQMNRTAVMKTTIKYRIFYSPNVRYP